MRFDYGMGAWRSNAAFLMRRSADTVMVLVNSLLSAATQIVEGLFCETADHKAHYVVSIDPWR
jgi:hypothetical protein